MRRHFSFTLLGLALCLGVAWWAAQPREPDPFYQYDARNLPAPGTLLRQEPFKPSTLPPDTTGFRILYTTTRPDGTAAVASAVVVVPDSAGAHPLIAYAHVTTGVRPGCAPSNFTDPFPLVPGFSALFQQGWAYVGTDYVGLGTSGTHFYMVGQDSARATLDSIRAAHAIPGLNIAAETVLWGHSQGGHSALWAAGLAPHYAPELDIRGVAAVSPASDLPALARSPNPHLLGKIAAAYFFDSYDRAYPGLDPWAKVNRPYRWLMKDIAGRCIESPKILFSFAEAALIPAALLYASPLDQGALGERLAENTPRGPFKMPVLIAQGASDTLIPTVMQTAYVHSICANTAFVTYHLYPGLDHLSIVDPASPLTTDLIEWTAERMAGTGVAEFPCP